jgi:hypothetical protein
MRTPDSTGSVPVRPVAARPAVAKTSGEDVTFAAELHLRVLVEFLSTLALEDDRAAIRSRRERALDRSRGERHPVGIADVSTVSARVRPRPWMSEVGQAPELTCRDGSPVFAEVPRISIALFRVARPVVGGLTWW